MMPIGVEADARAVEVEAGRLDRLLEIAAEPGIGDGALGVGHGEVIERLLKALIAVVHGVVVGEREQVEADIDEGFEGGRMAPEMERRLLALALFLGLEVVAVGDHRLEIGEGEVAVDLPRDAGGHVGERRDRPALVHALGIDRRVGRVEAGIAHQHDGHAIEPRSTGGWRCRRSRR